MVREYSSMHRARVYKLLPSGFQQIQNSPARISSVGIVGGWGLNPPVYVYRRSFLSKNRL